MQLPRSILALIVALTAQIAFAGDHGGSHSSGGTVHVNGYYRKDGTYVHSYDRVAPGTASYSAPTVPPLPTTSTATSTTSSATVPNTVTPYVAPIPANATVHVREYDRQDGTHVKEYVRSAPGYADTVVAVAASPKRENHTPLKNSSTESTSVNSTNTTLNHYSAVPYVNSTASGVQRDEHGRIKRSESAKHEFMRMTGYPGGRTGYVVDHIVPLKRGGCDCPSNMQWQTIQEAKAKDKWE